MKRVVVGLSGGVDSSVAAYLLKEQGYEVIGLFMKNWHDDSVTISNECPWLEDSNDALLVAEKLGIPFQTVDLSEQYKEKIVDYMFNEYEQGRTPNPDVLCNREIKFDVFMKIALSLGADYVATGHYCRKGEIEVDGTRGTRAKGEQSKAKPVYQLLAGKDGNKDQSYFLCQLSQEQLAKSLFPSEMMENAMGNALTPETIAGKLSFFYEQLHLLHWQTTSYAEHQALGGLYDYVHDFKDGLIEKIMGYTGKRPAPYKIEALINCTGNECVSNLLSFASSLKSYAESNSYHDIANLADALSGEAAKTKYLLTLS